MPFCPVPTGAFYRRHLDRFRDDDRRMVSAVLYLNEDWQPQDGGQLRMFWRTVSSMMSSRWLAAW